MATKQIKEYDLVSPVGTEKVLVQEAGDTCKYATTQAIADLFTPTVPTPISMTLTNGATNYGSGYEVGRYWKDANGIVHLEGRINVSGATVAATLPSGYRPQALHRPNGEGFNEYCLIGTDGTLTVYAGTTDIFDFTGITFLADGS